VCAAPITEITCGTLDQADWAFGEILPYVSRDVDVVPGDVVGSGTVPGGCLFEHTCIDTREDPCQAGHPDEQALADADHQLAELLRLAQSFERCSGIREFDDFVDHRFESGGCDGAYEIL
jgi:2-keto-4-pentenoate hydratase/2-oxohepta-3-ene-1,7-dioic acid hydratase in catechol pathway